MSSCPSCPSGSTSRPSRLPTNQVYLPSIHQAPVHIQIPANHSPHTDPTAPSRLGPASSSASASWPTRALGSSRPTRRSNTSGTRRARRIRRGCGSRCRGSIWWRGVRGSWLRERGRGSEVAKSGETTTQEDDEKRGLCAATIPKGGLRSCGGGHTSNAPLDWEQRSWWNANLRKGTRVKWADMKGADDGLAIMDTQARFQPLGEGGSFARDPTSMP